MAGSRLTMEILDIKPGTSTEDLQDDDDDVDGLSLFPVRRRLLSDLRESFSTSPDDRMKVYLRIRPFSSTETESGEQRDCMTVKTEKTVMTSAPHDSHAFKSSANRVAEYTFSHIFDEETSQKQFFNQTMMGLVKDFIDGQNCLVFTYGVTNSGKTYTMQGNPSDAGVLPRSLDVIFNSVQGRQWDKMNLKPSLFTNVKWLSAEEELAEKRAKLKVFKLCSDHDIDVTSLLGEDMSDISTANSTVSSDVSCLSTVSSIHSPRSTGDKGVFEELASRIREEMAVDVEDQGKLRYSIWVSFAEIYNEQIYDLLEPLPKKKDARRVCLKLKEDKNGSPYIHGLKDINVTSADEAYKLLTIGQRNLQTACTKLNHNSSRSHCIFNIKIIRVMDKPDPHVSRVSTLSLCDLAGSERYTKTQTTGERLKEAGSINTSLLTLSRCMEALRQTQKKKDKIVPFRESKLTRLFQNYFVGQGTAAMIVNVSQCASTFDETLQVFRFSAKAKQVITVQKPVFHKPKLPVILHNSPPPIARSSISWATPGPNNAGMRDLPTAANLQLPDEDDDMEEEEEEDSERMYTQADVDELLCVIEKVHTELDRIQKSNEKLEGSIRREVCKEMQQQFVEIERTCSDRIKIYEQITEDKYEKKIQLVMDAERAKRAKLQKMVDKDDEWVSSIVLHAEEVKVERLTDKNKELEEEIELLKSSSTQDNKFAELLKENEALKCKSVKNEISQTDNNEEDAMNYLHHKLETATASIDEQAIEISELNDMLTEAGETFEQKEVELSKLKTLLQEYEEKMETQSEAINVLETAAKDSVVAVETANESLTKRVECVTSLQTEIRELKGTPPLLSGVPESPPDSGHITSYSKVNGSRYFKSLSTDSDSTDAEVKRNDIKRAARHSDSSGIVLDYEADRSCTEDEDKISSGIDGSTQQTYNFRSAAKSAYPSPQTNIRHTSSDSLSQSSFQEDDHSLTTSSEQDFNELPPPLSFHQLNTTRSRLNAAVGRKAGCLKYQVKKPLNDSRVLQLVIAPVNNRNVIRQTKSSMLRLKNSPKVDPTRGRDCLKGKVAVKKLVETMESKTHPGAKRKHADEEGVENVLNVSKRQKMAVKGRRQSKVKRLSNNRVPKYNLRTRR